MKRETELELLDELVTLDANKSAFLDASIQASPVGHYTCPDRFKAEQEKIFRAYPVLVCHTSELPEPNSFITRDVAGLPVLITRDQEGAAQAFLNVCRHRGARLESQESGCKRMFSCPYHAWSYGADGTLKGVPHEKQGFPDLDRSAHSLTKLPTAEKHGWIFVTPNPT